MQTEQIGWSWRGETIRIGIDWLGSGPSVLLLPALSSISTRREMRPLQERLSTHYRTAAIDWPGFGDQSRPALDWTPEVYSALPVFPSHFGRCASACDHRGRARSLLRAQTRRRECDRDRTARPHRADLAGPIANHDGRASAVLRSAVPAGRHSGIGPLIYRLNVNQPVVRYMGAGHVTLIADS